MESSCINYRACLAVKRSISPRYVWLFVALFFCQDPVASGFGGGMTGYFQYANMPIKEGRIGGLAWGLGGVLSFNVSKNFRIGGMGSTYHLSYEQPGLKGSYIDMGYGGLCFEYCIPVKADNIALGVMMGGGRMTNLHVVLESDNATIAARYESNGMMVGTPIISYEHALTRSIFAMARIDCLMGYLNDEFVVFGGPGLRVGIVFKR